jgi:RimJ/RimL family protein N-acetyltransferase
VGAWTFSSFCRRGGCTLMERITFRPLRRADFPATIRWNHGSHAAPWFAGEPRTVAEVEAHYGPCIDGTEPTRIDVLEVNGRASGYLQRYRVRDHPDYRAAVGNDDAIAIDFIIGEPDLVGRGLGPRVIRHYVDDVVRRAYPEASRVISTPHPANERSIRALEKAGFRRGPVVDVAGQPEMVCTLELGP